MSSNQALQRVRRRLLAAKGGHAGTLDPMATGCSRSASGTRPRPAASCSARPSATGHSAARSATDTGDAEGSVIREAAVPALERPLVEAVLAGFVGDRAQVPPMYSALNGTAAALRAAREASRSLAKPATSTSNGCNRSRSRRETLIRGRLLEGHLCTCPGRGDRGRAWILRAPGRVARIWVEPFSRQGWFRSTSGAAAARRARCRASCLAPAMDLAFRAAPDRTRLYPGAASSPGARPRSTGWDHRISRNSGIWPDGGFLGLVAVGRTRDQVERLFVSGDTGPAGPATFT